MDERIKHLWSTLFIFSCLGTGNADNTFSIDSRLGFISVAKQLDRHVQPDFHMVVMATDHGQPAQSSTAAVHISVTVSNNAPPKFDRQEMATELQVFEQQRNELSEVF